MENKERTLMNAYEQYYSAVLITEMSDLMSSILESHLCDQELSNYQVNGILSCTEKATELYYKIFLLK